MSSDIISSLLLDTQFASSRIITVKENRGCDSSFITSCVLGHCIKNKQAVFIICTHNSLKHYQNIGLKMTYNLQKHIEAGLVKFCNIGDEVLDNVLRNEHNSLDHLFLKIKDTIILMKEQYESINVIFDGISHLFDCQYQLKEINSFCRDVIKLVRCSNNSFILFHCNVASEDDGTRILANLLSHMSYIVLEVENLHSGWSADVSGRLTIMYPGRKFADDNMFIMDQKHSHYLFKLFDRGVKLFAPGTV